MASLKSETLAKLLFEKVLVSCFLSFFLLPGVHAQQNLRSLFDAFTKASIELSISEQTDDVSESSYWLEQYSFYEKSINDVISSLVNNARTNPRENCQQALSALYKYSNIKTRYTVRSSLSNGGDTFNSYMALSRYCSRFGVSHDQNERM